MTSSFQLHQLYMMRSQVDIMRHAVELMIAVAEGTVLPDGSLPDAPACSHPEDRRVPASNMGEAPKFFCQVCRETVTE